MRLLLADDDLISLRLLENLLKKSNHEPVLANNGNEAWSQIMASPPPDIVILDWMMPGLDGLEITKKLRQIESDFFIYIILVTANSLPEDITAGLDAGANDYITKPFNKDELKSRIAVGCRVVAYEKSLKTMNNELRRFSSEMEQLAQQRAQQLVQADRMVTLGTMAAGIAHEINNPLTVIHGNLGLIKGFWKSFGDKAYRDFCHANQDSDDFRPDPDDITDMIQTAALSTKRIRSIIDGMRSFAHGQGGQIEEVDLKSCVNDAIQICAPKSKHLLHGVQCELNDLPFSVKGNPVQITQALVNLIGNAIDAIVDIRAAKIEVLLGFQNNHVELFIKDNGSGIPEEKLEDLWSPFYTTKPVGKGTGLGLAITRKIILEHGGDISVQSKQGQGTVFRINLPNSHDFDAYLKNQKEQKRMNEPSFLID